MSYVDEGKSKVGEERSLGWEERRISSSFSPRNNQADMAKSSAERIECLIHSWIHSFNSQLLHIYLIPETNLENNGSHVNTSSCPCEFNILVRGLDSE